MASPASPIDSPQGLKTIAEQFVGPIVIGCILNVTLHGVLMMQTQAYFQKFHRHDPIWLRAIVIITFTLATASAGLSAYNSYFFTVVSFGNLEKILHVTPPFAAMILSISTTAAPVQSFFGWRMMRLTGNKWLLVFCILSCCGQVGCASGVVYKMVVLEDFRRFQDFQPLVIALQSLAACSDVIITVTLVHYLRSHRTGVKNTDELLNRISRLGMQTGATTTVAVILGLTLFIGIDNNTDLVFNIMLPPLYANCLMSSLNARVFGTYGEQQLTAIDAPSNTNSNLHSKSAPVIEDPSWDFGHAIVSRRHFEPAVNITTLREVHDETRTMTSQEERDIGVSKAYIPELHADDPDAAMNHRLALETEDYAVWDGRITPPEERQDRRHR